MSVGNLVKLGWNYVTRECSNGAGKKLIIYEVIYQITFALRSQIFFFFKKQEYLDASVTEKLQTSKAWMRN
jgi:hypothetical protein